MDRTYRLVERFISINGEGQRAGELSAFLRFPGCNLSCSYCDTAWANSPEAEAVEYTGGELLEFIRKSGVKNVTLTGGEPLLAPGIGSLIELLLKEPGLFVEVETNGAIDISTYDKRGERLCMTLDYKLPGSKMEAFMRVENYEHVKPWDTVKFVCSDSRDLTRARDIINAHALTERVKVYLSPVFGRIDPAEMVEYMKQNNMKDVRLQLQLHKMIWSPDRRGV